MVALICVAMGFVAVPGAISYDHDLVLLLVAPLRRSRGGGPAVRYFGDLLGHPGRSRQVKNPSAPRPILVPLLVAAGIRRIVAGGGLVLGATFGGGMLSSGAQYVWAQAGATVLVSRTSAPPSSRPSLAGMVVAALIHQREVLSRTMPAWPCRQRAT
jgi:hypothetical protein